MASDSSMPDDNDDEISPDTERVVRKVKTAIAIMSLILILGFGAFVVAVVIKLSHSDGAQVAEGELALPQTGCTLDVPTQANIIDSSLDGDRLMIITVREGQKEALLFSLKTCLKLTTIKLGQS